MENNFGLRAIITYSDETEEYHYVPFSADLSEWQFASLAIIPKEPTKTVEKIRVVCAYEKNANIAYFDNIALVIEAAQSMKYDEEGNLISVTTTGLKEETNTYSGSRLIETVTGGNGTFTYDYDSEYKHRLISVSNSIVTQEFSYNYLGNVTGSTLESVDGGKKLSSSVTYTSDGNLVTSVTDTAGQTESYAYSEGG